VRRDEIETGIDNKRGTSMKTPIAVAALAAGLLFGAARADAQVVARSRVVTSSYSYGYYPSYGYSFANYTNGYYAGPGSYAPVTGYSQVGLGYPTYINSTAPGGRIAVATVDGTYIPPYSYTVVGHPYYARHYQGYGSNDFPFYGRIYGNPTDPWSWTYLSGGYYNSLARYYAPPL
jgi:hypothetical protein